MELTVKDIIDRLSKYPKDAKVALYSESGAAVLEVGYKGVRIAKEGSNGIAESVEEKS